MSVSSRRQFGHTVDDVGPVSRGTCWCVYVVILLMILVTCRVNVMSGEIGSHSSLATNVVLLATTRGRDSTVRGRMSVGWLP
jgi:hypothetical protein